jgi:hypothetical protein
LEELVTTLLTTKSKNFYQNSSLIFLAAIRSRLIRYIIEWVHFLLRSLSVEPITDKTHFLNAIIYTHRNPIHHGFCKSFDEWPHSSYPGIIYGTESVVETDKMLKIAGNIDDFIRMHKINLIRFESKTNLEIPDHHFKI